MRKGVCRQRRDFPWHPCQTLGKVQSTSERKSRKDGLCLDDASRNGANAENTTRDVVRQLQARWGGQFHGVSVVWRMWANHIYKLMIVNVLILFIYSTTKTHDSKCINSIQQLRYFWFYSIKSTSSPFLVYEIRIVGNVFSRVEDSDISGFWRQRADRIEVVHHFPYSTSFNLADPGLTWYLA